MLLSDNKELKQIKLPENFAINLNENPIRYI
jgi:hypothetical protein